MNRAPWALPTKGFSWNCNGLVNGQDDDRFIKAQSILQNLEKRDFACIQESHSTKARADPFTQWFRTRGAQVFWSHHNPKKAGVAIVINDAFASKFTSLVEEEIIPGNILRVRCTEASGLTLDIYSCYLPADSATLRRRAIQVLGRAISQNTHSLILGDFNFVSGEGDRFVWEHGRNKWQTECDPEARIWQDTFSGDSSLREIFQPSMTFKHTRFTSRIDRIYSNLGDGALVVLCPKAWTLDDVLLSDHKPVAVSLDQEYGHRSGRQILPTWTFKSPRFHSKVEELFYKEDGSLPSGGATEMMNRLLWSMATASLILSEEVPGEAVLSNRDKFNLARKALQALRNADGRELERIHKIMPSVDMQARLGHHMRRDAY